MLKLHKAASRPEIPKPNLYLPTGKKLHVSRNIQYNNNVHLAASIAPSPIILFSKQQHAVQSIHLKLKRKLTLPFKLYW